jgi:hypothetical protein
MKKEQAVSVKMQGWGKGGESGEKFSNVTVCPATYQVVAAPA